MPPEQDEPPATQWVKLPFSEKPAQAVALPVPSVPPPAPKAPEPLKKTSPVPASPQQAFDRPRETTGETQYYRNKSENSRLLIAMGILGFAVILLVIALLAVTFFFL